MQRSTFILLCALALSAADARALSIPRAPAQHYSTSGLYEGGSFHPANLESLRLAEHDGFERWVIDFSDSVSRRVGVVAPRFQLRYGKAIADSDKPARFLF